jgi:hypothetical protein
MGGSLQRTECYAKKSDDPVASGLTIACDGRYHAYMSKGDCYEAHIRFLREEVDKDQQDDWILCHGTVTNAAGNEIEHCWLEHNGFAYDFSNGNRFEFPVSEFRKITKARHVTVYSSEEVSVNVIRHGHFGPWK